MNATALAIDPVMPSNVYLGTEKGVYKSYTNGGNWFLKTDDMDTHYIYALMIDPTESGTVYAGASCGGILKSLNEGEDWVFLGAGSDVDGRCIIDLAVDPYTPNILYAGTREGGVLKSTDGGESWAAINDGLTSLNIRSLAMDPENTTIIYAGTEKNGLFQSMDG
jgi:photosystem II stability/assembly factor-like uncharacterized protein